MPKRKSLLQACADGDVELVKLMLPSKKKRINNMLDNHNWTALHHAVRSRNIECVRLLLQNTDIDVLLECHEGQTAFMWACLDDEVPIEIINDLLDHNSELVEFVNNECVSPLHSAVTNNRLDIVESLVNHGADVNYQDLDGDTPLHLTAIHANHIIMEYLLYHSNCDPTICNYQEYNSLDLIINLQHNSAYSDVNNALECLKHLIDFMYDVEDYPDNGLPELITSIQDTDILNFIIDKFFMENNSQKYFLDVLKQYNCYYSPLIPFFHDKIKSINDFHQIPHFSLLNFDFIVSIGNINHFFEICYEVLSRGLELTQSSDNDELMDILTFIYEKFSHHEQIQILKFLNIFGIPAHDIRDYLLSRFDLFGQRKLKSFILKLNPLSIRPAIPQSMNLLEYVYSYFEKWDILIEMFIPVYEKKWTFLRRFLKDKNINYVPSLKQLAVFELRDKMFDENSKRSIAMQLDTVERLTLANAIKDLILFKIY